MSHQSHLEPSNGSDPLKLILASSSPRRKDLMENAGLEFGVIVPDCDEYHDGRPEEIVVDNAARKTMSIYDVDEGIIIGCDTIGLCNGEILGKPVDKDDARRMLLLQQDHPCMVVSGIAVRDMSKGSFHYGYEVSMVEMDGGPEGVEEYLSSDLWRGKAGAFGIQDRGPIGAKVVSGEENNVMGLPMTLLWRLLSLVGFQYPKFTPSEGNYSKSQ